jgi:hypothetical protein
MTTDPTANGRRLFDIAGAVEYLHGIGASAATPNFVRAIIGRGEVAHLKIGKKFFVSREALDAWIQKHERRSR